MNSARALSEAKTEEKFEKNEHQRFIGGGYSATAEFRGGPRFIATKFGYRRMLDEMLELYTPAAPTEWPGHETKDEAIERVRDLEDRLRQLKLAYVNALTKANGEFAEYRQAAEAAIAKLNGEFAEYRQAHVAALAKANAEIKNLKSSYISRVFRRIRGISSSRTFTAF